MFNRRAAVVWMLECAAELIRDDFEKEGMMLAAVVTDIKTISGFRAVLEFCVGWDEAAIEQAVKESRCWIEPAEPMEAVA